MVEKITVLITPAGSGMAVVAIKAIKQEPDIKIAAADMNPLASGLHLVHKSYLVPRISDPSFFSKIDLIVKKEKVNVVIPCLDPFLLPFARRSRAFKEKGVKVVISPEKTVEICRDKWRTYTLLKNTIPMPKATTDFNSSGETYDNIGFPAILKSRSGSGSKDVYIVRDMSDLTFYLRKINDPMLQQRADGQEYTVDMLVGKDGRPLAIVPRKRIEVKAGISVKGEIELDPVLIEIGRKMCEKLRFFGPVNFQAIVDRKVKAPKVTEINPRISGGMSLTVASGVNIPLLSVYLAVGRKVIEIKLPKEHPLYMGRYLEEIILTSKRIENLEDFR